MRSPNCITNDYMERDATLIIRLPASLKERLRQAAEADHGRSLSGLAVRALCEWLDQHERHPTARRSIRKNKGRSR